MKDTLVKEDLKYIKGWDYVVKTVFSAWEYSEDLYLFKKDGTCAMVHWNREDNEKKYLEPVIFSLNCPVTEEDMKAKVGVSAVMDDGVADAYKIKGDTCEKIMAFWYASDVLILKRLRDRLRELGWNPITRTFKVSSREENI
jgi:hypothetical protein